MAKLIEQYSMTATVPVAAPAPHCTVDNLTSPMQNHLHQSASGVFTHADTPPAVLAGFAPWPHPPQLDDTRSTQPPSPLPSTSTMHPTVLPVTPRRQGVYPTKAPPATPLTPASVFMHTDTPAPDLQSDASSAADSGSPAHHKRRRKRKPKRRSQRPAPQNGWEAAWPWMRVACSLGVPLGGRVHVDRHLRTACPCWFGDTWGRGFDEYAIERSRIRVR